MADPAAHARSALHLLLEQHAANCVAELATSDNLLAELQRTAADVLLIDSQTPGPELGHLLSSVRFAYPNLRIVVLSTHPEQRNGVLASGADAFVSKGDAPEGLVKVLRCIGARSNGVDRPPLAT